MIRTKNNLSLHLIWSGQTNSFTRTQLRAQCRHKNGKVQWIVTRAGGGGGGGGRGGRWLSPAALLEQMHMKLHSERSVACILRAAKIFKGC